MSHLATSVGSGKTRAPAIWRPEPLLPAMRGSYRQAWLRSRLGICPELAAIIAELQFQPIGRGA